MFIHVLRKAPIVANTGRKQKHRSGKRIYNNTSQLVTDVMLACDHEVTGVLMRNTRHARHVKMYNVLFHESSCAGHPAQHMRTYICIFQTLVPFHRAEVFI